MSEKHEAIIRCFYRHDVFSIGIMDRATIERYLADDFVGHDLPFGLKGRDGYTTYMSLLAVSFSERNHIDVRDIFSTGDKVVARWSWRAKHTAEFMGIPATNRQITMKGIDIFRLAEGKIVDLWQEVDIMGILQQLSAPLSNEAI